MINGVSSLHLFLLVWHDMSGDIFSQDFSKIMKKPTTLRDVWINMYNGLKIYKSQVQSLNVFVYISTLSLVCRDVHVSNICRHTQSPPSFIIYLASFVTCDIYTIVSNKHFVILFMTDQILYRFTARNFYGFCSYIYVYSCMTLCLYRLW